MIFPFKPSSSWGTPINGNPHMNYRFPIIPTDERHGLSRWPGSLGSPGRLYAPALSQRELSGGAPVPLGRSRQRNKAFTLQKYGLILGFTYLWLVYMIIWINIWINISINEGISFLDGLEWTVPI